MPYLMSITKCEEIIEHVKLAEERYQQQLLSYEQKLIANQEIQAKHPKRTLKVLRIPEEPLHNYTCLSIAKKHLAIHRSGEDSNLREQLRKKALAKLSEEERKALGF